jgi:hypothetical protein
MENTSLWAFRTPVVREMTNDEYREQRRRVFASLIKDEGDQRTPGSTSPAS